MKKSPNFLWFKISKDYTKTNKDIYTCGLYIPLHNSRYFDDELFEELETDISLFSSHGSVLLMGDFNSRTGKYSVSICQEGSNVIPNDRSDFLLNPTQRNSFDNEVNNHGKRLLEICKSADLRILNGRVSGDSLGRATFHGRNGISVIDYALCDQDLFLNVSNFIVKQPTPLSDHSPIVTWLNINSTNSDTYIPKGPQNHNNSLTRVSKQFVWESDSTQKFKGALRSPVIQTLIQDYTDERAHINDVNTSLDKVENIFITTARQCLKIKTTKQRKRIQSSSNKKWFDLECRLKGHELRKLANQKHRDPLNPILRENYHVILMQYKSLLKSKKSDYCNSKLHSLEEAVNNSDAANVWKCLKSMDDTIKKEDTPLVSEENWLRHFESLHSNDGLNPIQQKICNELQEEEDRKKQFRPLDYLITENEIRKAAKKLKNNKSSYSDKIKNEMIKASINDLMPVYYKLFNGVLNSGSMPQTWCGGLITPIQL